MMKAECVMKPIAKILVPVTGAERDRFALATAIEAARPFGAHVQAVFCHPNPQDAVPQVGVPFSMGVVDAIIEGQTAYAQEGERAARSILAEVGAEKGARVVDAPDAGMGVSCSLVSEMGDRSDVISRDSRLADLVVFAPLRLPGFVDTIEAFLAVLTRAERPIIVASETPPKQIAKTVAIAWNGSRPAARAAMAAMPFLERAEKVFILQVTEPHSRPCAGGMEQYLALHGIQATRKTARLGPPSVGDMLAQEAADLGADLLVMGGYGHSQLRESFFGGATADALARATMPVLLAH
jgi:nucleotide-binding universal stress UspA family protein